MVSAAECSRQREMRGAAALLQLPAVAWPPAALDQDRKLKQGATKYVAAWVRALILPCSSGSPRSHASGFNTDIGCAGKAMRNNARAPGDADFSNPPMPDNSKSKLETSLAELNRVLSARTDAASGERVALREAVCAYLVAERARGTSLSDFTRTLKQLLRKAAVGGPAVADELAHQLVDWCMKFPLSPERAL